MKLIVGIIGEPCSGKTTFLTLLRDLVPNHTPFRDWSDRTETCYQILGGFSSAGHGIVVLPIRSETDAELVQLHHPSVVVYVTATSQNRYLRLKEVGRGCEPGHRITWKQFEVHDNLRSRQCLYQVSKRYAKYVIFNNDRKVALEHETREFFKTMIEPLLVQARE